MKLGRSFRAPDASAGACGPGAPPAPPSQAPNALAASAESRPSESWWLFGYAYADGLDSVTCVPKVDTAI